MLDPPDQRTCSGWRQAELRPLVPGQHVGVGVGSYAGNDPYQDVLGASSRHDRLQPVDVVRAVNHHQTNAVLDRHCDLFGGLGVSVQHDERGIDAGLERSQDLAATGDVESKSLLHHDPLHRRAGERLGGKHHPRVGPPTSQLIAVLPRAIPERLLGNHEHRSSELGCKIIGTTTTDDQHAVGIGGAAWREEIHQRAHVRMLDPATWVGNRARISGSLPAGRQRACVGSVRPAQGPDHVLGRSFGEQFDLRLTDGEHRVDEC